MDKFGIKVQASNSGSWLGHATKRYPKLLHEIRINTSEVNRYLIKNIFDKYYAI